MVMCPQDHRSSAKKGEMSSHSVLKASPWKRPSLCLPATTQNRSCCKPALQEVRDRSPARYLERKPADQLVTSDNHTFLMG